MSHELVLTLLYVPADRPDRVAKALGSDADVVIVDLEDAVAPASKEDARRALPGLLSGIQGRPVQVRVNASGTPWAADDLAMAASIGVEVRLPKLETPSDVDVAVEKLGSGRQVHCLVETPVGVEHAFAIASHPAVASIGLGEQDLRSALGVTSERGLDWPRGRIVNAASAAGLPPPVQSVHTAVRDLDGLAESCRSGRAMGFLGRCAIHPAQLPVIRAAYRPSPEEVRRAQDLVDALAGGDGVAVLADGGFVDAAMTAGARRTLEIEALATR